MTVIPDAKAVTVDGYRIGDYAAMVEEFTGLVGVAGGRGDDQSSLFRHGAVPSGPEWAAARTRTLGITLFDTDKDGLAASAYGSLGEWQENLDDLIAIFGKRGLVDYRRTILTASGPVTVQGYGKVRNPPPFTGTPAATKLVIPLVFEWPFLHELPAVSLSAATAHSFNTGGNAPVADMVLTFAGDGTLTDNLGHTIAISGSSGPVVVDVGKRTVTEAGVPAMARLVTTSLKAWWMEWPARTDVTLSSDVGVAVEFYRARH